MDALAPFHPAVRTWFERRFPLGPTEPQARSWPLIAAGADTLIAAPTGSGKTLSAFLVCIDQMYRAAEAFEAAGEGVRVVYVSPLKALAADIHQNLTEPVAEIAAVAEELGFPVPDLRVALRSGDTPASARAAMLKHPPQFLITTPESLYLMVTANRSREILRGVRTIIVDEIHAVARDKRGSHLALTLERLTALNDEPPTRVGLSATQRPLEVVARLLVGAGETRTDADQKPLCEIVDEGHRRELDVAIELPDGELEAVMAKEQLDDVLAQIALHVARRRTTLVFVNTRRMAERLAHLLSEKLGDEVVASHHGSLSKDRRLRVEAKLRAGELKVLVATASLELGIDIGPVELVCQIGSPRNIATFIQRVGRSGHSRGATPVGRLYPLTRDDLVECAALLRAVKAGRLDALRPPIAPLDILAQQIVAACGAEDWHEDALFELMRGAAPYAALSRSDFDEVVEMLSDGIVTGRGRRAAYLHRDRVNGMLRGRRGARLASLTSGGAIPETADYRVIAGASETFVGTVDEDWAIESMAGDIFLLGSTSWRITRVESGRVRVEDAGGAPPTIPFWFGEAPSRSVELSDEVSALRADFERAIDASDEAGAASWLQATIGLNESAAQQTARYLAVSRVALGGRLPTQSDLVIERFFDDTGGMQLVVHSPFGGRLNRALGLALRKRFCVNFNFELQAAASDDSVVLSLGPQHSFPLESVPRFLSSTSVREVLSQAVLTSPMFTARWRWNLNRSLAVLRMRGGKRNPPPIQRMEADDLMASVFPGLAACQENAAGPVEIPDHVLVRQTMRDCLEEAMDIDGLEKLVAGFESGAVTVHCVDSNEPSPLCHEIINSRPFTFLDDAPLEERRTRAVSLRRGLPVEARELGRLDAEAIARVATEAAPEVRGAEELHDLLLSLVVMPPRAEWRGHFEELVLAGRACRLERSDTAVWCAAERVTAAERIFTHHRRIPPLELPQHLATASEAALDPDAIAVEIVRGHLECTGVVQVRDLAVASGLEESAVEIALGRLESEGAVLRGCFDPDRANADGDQFCARRLLTRIHRYTQARLRREIEPVHAQDFMRFLLRWQHVAPGTRREGRAGVAAVIEQLQGFEAGAGIWEENILSARVDVYRADWLDSLCLSGEVAWGRLALGISKPEVESAGEQGASPPRGGAIPSRVTPITFALRSDLEWLLQAGRAGRVPEEFGAGAAAEVLACLRERGALFHSDLVFRLDRLPVEIEEGLWGLVARGWVTADGFQAVRSLLGARERWARTRARERARRGLRRGLRAGPGAAAEGRWSLLPEPGPVQEPDELAEAVAEQLLARWGVVFRDLMVRETLGLPWRDVLWALRRLEARGLIRGGRFVSGFAGEQFALPGAVDALRRVRRKEKTGERVRLSATDPLNLVGIVLDGPRVPAVRTRWVTYRDGLYEGADETAGDGASSHAQV